MKYDIDNHIDGLLYGLQFEKALPNLIKEIEDAKKQIREKAAVYLFC